MLFQPQARANRSGTPAFIRQLDLLCKNLRVHQLPLRMVLIGESFSDRGQPTAVYACPHCNHREGWVQDRHTGRPFRLWHRSSNHGH